MATIETAPTVVQALASVMEDVQAIGKEQRNTTQNYSFRGIDAVINAVGPALRAHGVIAVPVYAEQASDYYDTKSGTRMRSVTLTVTWRFYGPAGDFIECMTIGEAADAGDKAMPKAHSVAYRILLLQALCIPTDDPDPDAESHERVTGGAVSGGSHGREQTPEEILAPLARELERLQGVKGWSEPEVVAAAAKSFGRPVESLDELTAAEVRQVTQVAKGIAAAEAGAGS